MALWGGIDTVAFVSGGVYTETYGSTQLQNICNLFAFYGMLEDAPTGVLALIPIMMDYYRRRREN